uniref:HECT-type E3 ubiquitin transferase n=1 Tax=Blastobotrys adeninivorans TaxID=409370 RepID=A0A060SZV9_BLAAD
MPWFFSRKKQPSSTSQQQQQNGRARRDSENFAHNVSTMSSVGAIVSSVSAANMAQNPRAKPSQDSDKLVIKKCICCGTKLQVPDKLPYFKCSICDTFHDVKPPKHRQAHSKADSPYVVPLTVELVMEAIKIDNESNCGNSPPLYSELEKLLAGACSNVAVMNQSFSLGLDKMSYSRPNIDYAKVDQFYCLLESLDSHHPMKVLITSLIALLKRLGQALESPTDITFLLIILENPLLYNYSIFSAKGETGKFASLQSQTRELLERTVGLLAHCPKRAKHYLLNWLSRFPVERYSPKVDLLNAYVAHRLTLHYYNSSSGASGHRSGGAGSNKVGSRHSRSLSESSLSTPTTTQLSSAMFSSSVGSSSQASSSSRNHQRMFNGPMILPRPKKRRSSTQGQIKPSVYGDDWRIAAFVRVLAILFNANTVSKNKIPISAFYNSMVDFTDVASDFDDWQRLGVPTSSLTLYSGPNPGIPSLTSHRHHHSTTGMSGHSNSHHNSYTSRALASTTPSSAGYFAHGISDFPSLYEQKVAFCQYPFLLSMGSKTQILEYDARRQMEYKAQEAFFGALDRRCSVSPFLHIRVDRNHILQDSFEAFDSNEDDLKKSLKVEFVGEPGVDAGGLRKEWFLLLVRELFSPSIGLFYEDDESRYFWFDSMSNGKPLKYYKFTGVAVGLALYNSTILDINFPPLLYKKLLGVPYTLEDFITFTPSYGRSLQALLDYEEDDLEEVFSLNFCLYIREKDGSVTEEVLVPDGANISVTKANRHDYVRRVINYYLDTSIKRQFEAFKQGFYKVVGGNALTLFRPEEIELLIRGSPEPIDVDALRSVTKYQHWGPKGYDASEELVIKWFWKYFQGLSPQDQRKLLVFVTGSDRIPATGIANMAFRISKIGDDCERFPTSHTCFNQLCLYAYSSRAKLEDKLTIAINESQGFGIK